MAAAAAALTKVTYILVTGDRDWPEKDYSRILAYFTKAAETGPFVLIEGECRGADLQARRAAEALKMPVIPMPADWEKKGKSAGPIRNRAMIDLLIGMRDAGHPAIMVYFHDRLETSRGTKNAISQAAKLGITAVNGGI